MRNLVIRTPVYMIITVFRFLIIGVQFCPGVLQVAYSGFLKYGYDVYICNT